MKTILLTLSLLLAACTARPPEAIQADRDTWTFYTSATADGVLDPAEKNLSDTRLADWNAALLIEERGTGDLKSIALDIALAVGDAFLRDEGTAYMRAHYPDVFPIFDTNEDGVITLAELRALDPRDPKVWVSILFALKQRRRA